MPFSSIDGTLKGTSLDEYQTACLTAAEKLGRPWTRSKSYERWMREAGLVDVVEKIYYWATNQWVKGKRQKPQARWLQADVHDGLSAWGDRTLSRGLGWSRERIDVLLEEARNDLKDPNTMRTMNATWLMGGSRCSQEVVPFSNPGKEDSRLKMHRSTSEPRFKSILTTCL